MVTEIAPPRDDPWRLTQIIYSRLPNQRDSATCEQVARHARLRRSRPVSEHNRVNSSGGIRFLAIVHGAGAYTGVSGPAVISSATSCGGDFLPHAALRLASNLNPLAGAGAAVHSRALCSRSWRSTAALVLDVAQALLGERCRRWRWSVPATSMPSWTSPATSTRRGAVVTNSPAIAAAAAAAAAFRPGSRRPARPRHAAAGCRPPGAR